MQGAVKTFEIRLTLGTLPQADHMAARTEDHFWEMPMWGHAVYGVGGLFTCGLLWMAWVINSMIIEGHNIAWRARLKRDYGDQWQAWGDYYQQLYLYRKQTGNIGPTHDARAR